MEPSKYLKSVCNALRRDIFTSVVLLGAAIYVSLAWTPSSYSLLFDRLGAEPAGLVMGEPRAIREDEWSRWTPFVQATVNNDFERLNHSSIYEENLRNVEGLPLLDWAIVLKPSFWPFFLVDPAWAFSFHHAFWIVLFLIGYHRLFREFEVSGAASGLASLALFSSSFSQTWWTTYGPVMAGFPWVMLALILPSRAWVRGLLAMYATSVWLLGNLYPPIMISLAFVAFTALLALRPECLAPRRLAPGIVGVLAAGALVVLYLGDVFSLMAGTHYPGQRISGGGGPPPVQWLAHFFPFIATSGYSNLVTWNICEASTLSSYLPLLALFFVDYPVWIRELTSGSKEARRIRRQLIILAAGALLTSIWILVPVPTVVGMPLLWHFVPANRMWFACGLMIFLLALVILRTAPLGVSWPRVTAFSAAVALSWFVSEKWLNSTPQWGRHEELWILIPLLVLVLFRAKPSQFLRPALIGCAAIANVLAFGGFNPIQSAVPIFDPTTVLEDAKRSLDRVAQRHPKGWLVLPQSDGAWLNGLGYQSVTHILLAPEVDWFRPWFPGSSEETLDVIFNRTAYVVPTLQSLPSTTGGTGVSVPVDVFEAPTIDVDVLPLPFRGGEIGGRVQHEELHPSGESHVMMLWGWGNFDGSNPETRLTVYTDLPVESAIAYPAMWPESAGSLEDPSLIVSGLALRLQLRDPDGRIGALRRAIAATPICVVSEDPLRGRFLLQPARLASACRVPG